MLPDSYPSRSATAATAAAAATQQVVVWRRAALRRPSRRRCSVCSIPSTFHQCLVFCNRGRARQLVNTLNAAGFPSAFISGQHTQAERTTAMSRMRAWLRVLVATDLLARGVDFGRVTLVLHQLPRDLPTYLHRVGRAGRFATRGLSVMIAWDELPLAQKMLAPLAITVTPLPLHLHQDAYLEPISVGATGTADGGSGGAA